MENIINLDKFFKIKTKFNGKKIPRLKLDETKENIIKEHDIGADFEYRDCVESNCSIEEFIKSSKIIKKKKDDKDFRLHAESVLIKWLNKNFSDMEFTREYEDPLWTKTFRYDAGSKKFKVVIELDGKNHFYPYPIKSEKIFRETKDRDCLKNKLAIDNNFSIIRIRQCNLYYDANNWQIKLANYLHGIQVNTITGGFFWIGGSKSSEKIYSYQASKLSGFMLQEIDNSVLIDSGTEILDEFREAVKSFCGINSRRRKKHKYVVPHTKTSISKIISQIKVELNEGVKLDFELHCKLPCLGKQRSPSLCCLEKKVAIIIDYGMDTQWYRVDPEEKQKIELEKTILLLNGGFTCIRVFHKIYDSNPTYLIDTLIKIIKNLEKTDNTSKYIWLNTESPVQNRIYKTFDSKISQFLKM